MCLVIGRTSELKQSNDDHIKGIKINLCKVYSIQSTEVEKINEQKQLLVLVEVCATESYGWSLHVELVLVLQNHMGGHWSLRVELVLVL